MAVLVVAVYWHETPVSSRSMRRDVSTIPALEPAESTGEVSRRAELARRPSSSIEPRSAPGIDPDNAAIAPVEFQGCWYSKAMIVDSSRTIGKRPEGVLEPEHFTFCWAKQNAKARFEPPSRGYDDPGLFTVQTKARGIVSRWTYFKTLGADAPSHRVAIQRLERIGYRNGDEDRVVQSFDCHFMSLNQVACSSRETHSFNHLPWYERNLYFYMGRAPGSDRLAEMHRR